MAFNPVLPLVMNTAAVHLTPVEAGLGVLQVVELVQEDIVTDTTLD